MVNHSPPILFDQAAATGGDWHTALREAIRDPDELLDLLQLGDEFRAPARRAAELFPLFVTRSFVERMQRSDPSDPLLLQVLPLGAEETELPGFTSDAVGDGPAHRAPGILQKYAGRALLIASGACAVHCRYCFRRHYPYGAEPRRMEDWEPALALLAGDPTLNEVILSGGDPLMLTDHRLGELLTRLESIPHLNRLRIHSRLPIVLPERVTSELLGLLTGLRLTPMMVVHANHPRELAGRCGEALRALVRAGITVLNQAVLLKGINDDVDVLARLCLELVDRGVLPYYLHQLDRVAGTAHFEVPVEVGRQLIAALRSRLPGYAVPQYVQEIEGAPHKVPLN
jgi:EF-P beta-lysylation protein EpmB